MVISYCIPIRNRLEDVKLSLVEVIKAAKRSPPIEIAILDYGSDDGLEEYVKTLPQLNHGNSIKYTRPANYKYYHMAHARNLSMLAGSGDYLVGANADNLISGYFFHVIRVLIDLGAVWITPDPWSSLLIIKKEEFVACGGFDERFEFYGPEDKEIVERLYRRGKSHKKYSRSLICAIYTDNDKKMSGYRLKLMKRTAHKEGWKILLENREKELLVANPDGWGRKETIYGRKCNYSSTL